jgi:hypothetical protein
MIVLYRQPRPAPCARQSRGPANSARAGRCRQRAGEDGHREARSEEEKLNHHQHEELPPQADSEEPPGKSPTS